MSKKSLILLVVTAFVVSLGLGVTMSLADDAKGPAEITLNPDNRDAAKKGKPAVFPHAKHQEKNECGVCHHHEDAGAKVACTDDTLGKIAKCDSCHNAEFPNEKLRKWKDIGHGQCKKCHTKMKAEGAPTKCAGCHPKKK